ncbi:phage holin family protein [Rhodoblastus sp.]|uniref:phage holin family protein n=2 Tax=Rhodoblastus sp. TaxID=1962975 RepID=UPI003F987C1B
MDSTIRNFRVFWRAETIVADVRLRQLASRMGFKAAAVALGLFGVIMVNIAIFFALQQTWGSGWAASAIGGANIFLAIVLFFFSESAQSGRDLDLALEVRDLALKELETDAIALRQQLVELRGEIIGIRQSVGNFIHNPIDTALPQLLIPLINALIHGLRKSTAAKS